jgi:flagellar biosynthesis protein FliR
MEPISFSYDHIKIFLLILTRISIVTFLFPIFGSPLISNPVKTAFALVFTLILFPVVEIDLAVFPDNVVELILLVASEICIGLMLGLTVRMLFAAVQLAGRVAGFQMGFGMINVIDPISGANVGIMDQIGYWVVLIVFMMINGHHVFIMALVESFQLLEMGQFALPGGFLEELVDLSGDMFKIAVKIGAPTMAALLFVSVGFGMAAKFVPQIPIMIVGFPLKITVGLVYYGIMLDILLGFTRNYVSDYKSLLMTFIKWMGGE